MAFEGERKTKEGYLLLGVVNGYSKATKTAAQPPFLSSTKFPFLLDPTTRKS